MGPSIGGPGYRQPPIKLLKVRKIKAGLMQSFLASELWNLMKAAPRGADISRSVGTTRLAIDAAVLSVSMGSSFTDPRSPMLRLPLLALLGSPTTSAPAPLLRTSGHRLMRLIYEYASSIGNPTGKSVLLFGTYVKPSAVKYFSLSEAQIMRSVVPS